MNTEKIHIRNRNEIVLRFGVLPGRRLKFLRSWVSCFVCHLFQSPKRELPTPDGISDLAPDVPDLPSPGVSSSVPTASFTRAWLLKVPVLFPVSLSLPTPRGAQQPRTEATLVGRVRVPETEGSELSPGGRSRDAGMVQTEPNDVAGRKQSKLSIKKTRRLDPQECLPRAPRAPASQHRRPRLHEAHAGRFVRFPGKSALKSDFPTV